MKKRYYIAGVSLLVAVLAVVAIYNYERHEKPESSTLTASSGKSDKIGRLFRDMGIIRVTPTAPPFDLGLQDLSGRVVELSEFKGKIVFLNFWASWCQACRDEMPVMEKLHNKFKNTDFAMLAVDLQEPASIVKNFFTDYKLSFTALLDSDGKARSSFGVGSIPSTLILDKEGMIIGSAAGPREWDSQKSFALFEHLINEGAAPDA